MIKRFSHQRTFIIVVFISHLTLESNLLIDWLVGENEAKRVNKNT